MSYEELCTEPDFVQAKLSNMFGLTGKWKFSDYPEFVPEAEISHTATITEGDYSARPITPERIHG